MFQVTQNKFYGFISSSKSSLKDIHVYIFKEICIIQKNKCKAKWDPGGGGGVTIGFSTIFLEMSIKINDLKL